MEDPATKLPRLWLHPLHLTESKDGISRLSPTIVDYVEDRRGRISCTDSCEDEDQLLPIFIDSHSIKIPCSQKDVLEIDLLCARVALIGSTFQGRRIITVEPSIQPEVKCAIERSWLYGKAESVWLIIADDPCPKAIYRSLEALGAAGCVRTDLHMAYEVSNDILGEGANASVRRVRTRPRPDETRTEFALKVLNAVSAKTVASVAREVAALRAVNYHPNVIGFRGLFLCDACDHEDQDAKPQPKLKLSVMMEYAAGGDLHNHIVRTRAKTEAEASDIMHGLLCGLAKVHQVGLMHRDVKAENVLLTHNGRILLCDFGLARLELDPMAVAECCGSPGYVAPEILSNLPYGCKVDVFSAGVVFYFVLSKMLPFHGSDVDTVLRRNLRAHISLRNSPAFAHMSMPGTSLLLAVLKRDPAKRPSSSAALTALGSWTSHLASQEKRSKPPRGAPLPDLSGSRSCDGEGYLDSGNESSRMSMDKTISDGTHGPPRQGAPNRWLRKVRDGFCGDGSRSRRPTASSKDVMVPRTAPHQFKVTQPQGQGQHQKRYQKPDNGETDGSSEWGTWVSRQNSTASSRASPSGTPRREHSCAPGEDFTRPDAATNAPAQWQDLGSEFSRACASAGACSSTEDPSMYKRSVTDRPRRQQSAPGLVGGMESPVEDDEGNRGHRWDLAPEVPCGSVSEAGEESQLLMGRRSSETLQRTTLNAATDVPPFLPDPDGVTGTSSKPHFDKMPTSSHPGTSSTHGPNSSIGCNSMPKPGTTAPPLSGSAAGSKSSAAHPATSQGAPVPTRPTLPAPKRAAWRIGRLFGFASK